MAKKTPTPEAVEAIGQLRDMFALALRAARGDEAAMREVALKEPRAERDRGAARSPRCAAPRVGRQALSCQRLASATRYSAR